MDNPESYQPLLVAVDVVLRREFPLLDVAVLSALSERILGDLQDLGALIDLDTCIIPNCGQPVLFGTPWCPAHERET